MYAQYGFFIVNNVLKLQNLIFVSMLYLKKAIVTTSLLLAPTYLPSAIEKILSEIHHLVENEQGHIGHLL